MGRQRAALPGARAWQQVDGMGWLSHTCTEPQVQMRRLRHIHAPTPPIPTRPGVKDREAQDTITQHQFQHMLTPTGLKSQTQRPARTCSYLYTRTLKP